MAEENVSEIRLFRFGRLPDPLALIPWEYVGGFRFDDPERQFRVLYAAEQRKACLVEKLASLRPPPDASSSELARVLAEMEGNDEQGQPVRNTKKIASIARRSSTRGRWQPSGCVGRGGSRG